MVNPEFISQFGETLVNPSDNRASTTPDALAEKKFVMLYFSAHWCPPCRQFTPRLIETYKKLKARSTNFELVFCSLDRDKKEWEEYTENMPWLCMPFGAEESQKMAKTYGAQGIPHLVVVDGTTGEVVTQDGTEEVGNDPEGTKFPWRPKSMAEIWPAQILASKSSGTATLDSSALKDKYLMLYFSAHWCPPCKAFTPVLSKAYTKLKAERDDFELVFVSSDRSEEDFKEYFGEMTFCALPFEHRAAKQALSKKYDVQGIPRILMLGPVSNKDTLERPLVNKNIRSVIDSGDFLDFPFLPKNYGDVEGADDIEEVQCVIVFHEGGDDDEQQETKDALKEAAEKMKDRKDMKFLWALSTKGMAQRIRSVLDMPKDPMAPAMIILDLPDRGGYYTSNVTDINAKNIMQFVESPGERKQLQ
mmetsp:Transcript_3936/g.7507  ORF Transcript_3936/g.7507 Transcript_3936/m.7507 type:complete len:418 (-) Transcript_3936:522-1775(-)|eukprot:CAMPEP_0113312366 /NCGR_PEP_ID=MMETSP0010_2-20120614/9230_1 /TAXON_ID=216773 ORGANISM="Corethron hystrix, Strain 308" /NCGR_SAMPLE_ID=MMETSP0010_2 /ASSEMBLY_ACC=CAM_ASM_000155 /LENGTH=417 /DNA_ID=CAMNT_0000168187 /DNA_START=23 /DNA_END=1276 /DNA_ORIENTATION=+ /assembly_acc=CAM_ASM_000155